MVFLALSAYCIEPVEILLWEKENPPTSNGLSPEAEDSKNPDRLMYVSQPTMTVFPAENPNGTALLMCPGGGYFTLAAKHEGSDFAEILNEKGITLAVLKYRVPNGHHEVPADDARQAIRLLRRNADKWGINPERIGIGGASAGGHLAATVATHPMDDESLVNFQVLLYPVISMQEGLTHKGSRENLLGVNPSQELVDFYSNELQVTEITPKAFISATIDDKAVPVENTFKYYDALTSKGVDVDMKIYPKGGHGWAYRPQSMPYHSEWLDDLTGWLERLDSPLGSQNNEWTGKKVAILGDSMSDPRKKFAKKRFYNYLEDSLGIEAFPYAVSGFTWKDLMGEASKLRDEHPDDLDAIIIWAGTNDYNKSIDLGDFFNIEKAKINVNGNEEVRAHRQYNQSENTFTGRINNLLGYLKKHYPETQIVIMTPIHRGYAKFNEKNVQPSEEYSNALGLFIDDYVATIKRGAEIWSMPVIDLFSESGILPALSDHSVYIVNPETDRLHPNDNGHKRIAKLVENRLKTLPSSFDTVDK